MVNNVKDFNAKKEVENIIKFIKEYYKNNNLGGAVIGISGGKDSAVVAALFTKALGSENIIGISMPCHSEPNDMIDAKIISDYYNFELINFDLTSTYETFKKELNNSNRYLDENTINADINLKPRLRMSTLYYFAALYSSIKNKTYIVAGTSNKCELYVGYFTKGGDSVYDISVLADYNVDEVIKIGEYLSVPNKILYKKPNDGLSNLSDEDKLGVKYKDISDYIENKKIDKQIEQRIYELHKNARHKFIIPTYKRGIK